MKTISSIYAKLMLIIALILSPAFAGKVLAQPPASTPYVDLITATPATPIRIKLAAEDNNTTVWISIGMVAGVYNYEQITIGTDLQTNYLTYTPVGSRLRVCGAVTKLDCSGTSANDRNTVSSIEFSTNNTTLLELYCSYNQISSLNLTQASALQILNCSNNQVASLNLQGLNSLESLDFSNNKVDDISNMNISSLSALRILKCYGNPYTNTTFGLDQIYCKLPHKLPSDLAKIHVFEAPSQFSSTPDYVLATNASIAINKKWKVCNSLGGIITTYGTYQCGNPPPNMPLTELTTSGQTSVVDIRLLAAQNNTPVWIKTTPDNYKYVSIGSGTGNYLKYTAVGNSIKIYGAVTTIDCHGDALNNRGPVTAVNATGNSGLKKLLCSNNQIHTLTFALVPEIDSLYCSGNSLTSLDVSELTQLTCLNCDNNQLTSLNVSGLSQLQELYCYDNQLTSLDVSGLNELKYLWCFNNQFSTFALDQIYCQLPDRSTNGLFQGKIYVSSVPVTPAALATNRAIANNKNWIVIRSDLIEITNTTGSYVCGNPPQGMQVIEMTTGENATIRINLQAAANNTPVWIESTPGIFTPIRIGTSWTGWTNYTVSGTRLRICGAVSKFDCSGASTTDRNNIAALKFSGNTGLTYISCSNTQISSIDITGFSSLNTLYCCNNPLTAIDLDRIYCQLPQRATVDNAKIYVSEKNSLTNIEPYIIASNRDIANSKNWKLYSVAIPNFEITNTNGTHSCDDFPPVGAPVIELTTSTAGAGIRMQMKAAQAGTPVWIETAPETYTSVNVGTDYSNWETYTLSHNSTSLKVYGNITGFDCRGLDANNRGPVSAINVSGNKFLRELNCANNNLSNLDVSALDTLQILYCYNNNISNLLVSGLPRLEYINCLNNKLSSINLQNLPVLHTLYCSNNNFTSINLTGLTQLKTLSIENNQLSSIDLQGLSSLEDLYCSNNALTSINVQNLNSLYVFHCYGNPCTSTTLGLDQMYCQLPDRTSASRPGKIFVSKKALDQLEDFVLCSATSNANSRRWYAYSTVSPTSNPINNANISRPCGSIPVTDVTLDPTTLTLTVNGTRTLIANVLPADATNKNVTWASSNQSVATVDNTGKVTANSVGNATITVKTDDCNKTAECLVTVNATNVSVTDVTLYPTTLTLTVNGTRTLIANVLPADATNKNVTWQSSNQSVATVDNTGKVTAKSVGTATITVKTDDGNFTAACSVTVSAATVSVTGVTVTPSTLTLTVNGTRTLTANVLPANATNKVVTWESSNQGVATVDNTGKVTAKSVGTATITVKTDDGNFTAACSVTVSAATATPTVISTTPTEDAQNVTVYTSTITITFDKAINATSKTSLVLSAGGAPVATMNISNVIINGSVAMFILPAGTVLDGSTEYTAILAANSFQNSNIGNEEYSWNFSTAIATIPLTFSRTRFTVTVTWFAKDGVDYTAELFSDNTYQNQVGSTYTVTGNAAYTTHTFNNLQRNTTYYVKVTGVNEVGTGSIRTTRLKESIVSMDGSFEVTKITPMPIKSTAQFTLATDKAGLLTVSVYGLAGEKLADLLSTDLNAGDEIVVPMSFANLASGTYTLVVNLGGETIQQRIVISK